MIDFATLKGLTIPEGVVVKIESGGVVLWELQSSGTVILEVEKITSNTYAGETTYNSEQFILLDIYPKSGGTVNITYGGLTKTITDDGTSTNPNAQQVFFGTFNGVSDEIETPVSGTLTIDGDYDAFGVGSFSTSSKNSGFFAGITEIIEFGKPTKIPVGAFTNCVNLTDVIIPSSVTAMGDISIMSATTTGAFSGCSNLKNVHIPNGVTMIGDYTFYNCTSLAEITIPTNLATIGVDIFSGCTSLETITILCLTEVLDGMDFDGCKAIKNFIVREHDSPYYADGALLFNASKSKLCAYPSVSGAYDIPDSIQVIGRGAFNNTELAEVTIPTSVIEIGEFAFAECKNLVEVTIPSSVTKIGGYAFSSCSGLQNVTMLSTNPPTLGTSSFSSTSCTITVPVGCAEAYKAAEGWIDYADRIMEAS